MNREEVCSLQLPPPWKLRGNMLNYGLGLLSSYFVCDTLTILSGGYFYIFDPLGLTGGATSTATSSARYFSLLGAELDHSIYSPCFQDGWTGLDAWGPSRTSRTINRRPGRLIDPGRVPWSSWSSPIWGTYIYHIYNIYIYTIVITIHTLHHIYIHTHTHTLIYYIF